MDFKIYLLSTRKEVKMEREIFTKSISYADNIVSRIELLISLPPHDWYIFENQPFYQELIDFLHNIQT